MGFAGADLSLVGEAVTLPDGRQVRPPADWQPAAPQVLEQVRQQASIDAGPFMTEAHAIWIAPEGDGMLIVSEVRPAIDGSEGTGAGEPDIVAAVRSQFADRPGVHEETFITPGGVAVWQFRIEVEQPVAGWSVKLLLPPRDDGSRVQLDYFMASQSVPRLMQAVGTSISTISEAGNGGGEGAAVGGEDGTN